MATYTITYLSGDTETVKADGIAIEYGEYCAYRKTDDGHDITVAWMPAPNVRSIHLLDDAPTTAVTG